MRKTATQRAAGQVWWRVVRVLRRTVSVMEPRISKLLNDLRMLEPAAASMRPGSENQLSASVWATRVRTHAARYGMALHLDARCKALISTAQPITVELPLAEVRDSLCWVCGLVDTLAEQFDETALIASLINLLELRDRLRLMTAWEVVPALRQLDTIERDVRECASRVERAPLAEAMLVELQALRATSRARLAEPLTRRMLIGQLDNRAWSHPGGAEAHAMAVERLVPMAGLPRPVECDILDALLLGSTHMESASRAFVTLPEALLDVVARSARPFARWFRFSEPFGAEILASLPEAVLAEALVLWDPTGDGPLRSAAEAVSTARALNR